LEIGKNNISDPNPFTLEEIETICTTPTNNLAARNLAQFMLWTGPRPSEALALAWEDVNLKEGYLYIRRALVTGKYKSTKTRRSRRIVELLPKALAALESQQQFTLQKEKQAIDVIQIDNRTLRTETIRSVFLNRHTQKPYPRSDAYINSFWKTHLKKAGVTYRGVNQCRHTFASQMLSIPEVPDAWIVQQLGHADTTMLYKHYGQLMQLRNRNRIVDIAALHLQQHE
jgi:integrase